MERGRRRRQTEAPADTVTSGGFLDPVAVSRLETLPIKAKVIVEGALSGLHRARLHGSSVEFAEHKEYSPGDEIRHIDWKVYGRADRFYVKQYEQESELTCYLVLDASGSMAYGSPSKLEYAATLLGALAYLLIRQRDKVGLLVYGDRTLDRYVPPRARPAHLHDILTVLEEVSKQGGRGDEPAAATLDKLGELSRNHRSLVFLASDLFDDGARESGDNGGSGAGGAEHRGDALGMLRRLRARKHDVTLLQVLHRDELILPFEGLTLFESLEGQRELLADPQSVRKEYLERLEQFLRHIKAGCSAGGIAHQLIATDEPLEKALLDLLAKRGA